MGMDDELGYGLDEQILAGDYSDEMGAAPRRGGAMQRVMPSRGARLQQRMSQLQSDRGGQAFNQITPFASSNALLAATPTATLTANPQRQFQLQRIVISVGRNNVAGTTATNALITVTQIMIGASPQFTSTGAVPVEMFGSTAVDVRLFANAARPGITIVISLAESGLTSTDNVTQSGGAIGPVLD